VLKVLLRSLPDLRAQLDRAVATLPRPLFVAQEGDEASGGEFARRQPYRYLLEHQAKVSMVVVADDPLAGLWRDPVGDLAAQTFPDRRSASEAASGYLLFFERSKPDFIKRDLWDRYTDVAALITRLGLQVPLPPRQKEPIKRKRPRATTAPISVIKLDPEPVPRGKAKHQPGPRRPAPPPSHKAKQESERRRPAPPVEPEFEGSLFGEGEDAPDTTPGFELPIVPEPDPFATLGIRPTATEAEVRKAFLALIVQYHPDKVAHLAPEFRLLAESRSRELTEAYELAQRMARGEEPF
jgi:hypothetical protein